MIKITPCTVVLKGEISNRDQNSWVILTVKAGHFNMRVRDSICWFWYFSTGFIFLTLVDYK